MRNRVLVIIGILMMISAGAASAATCPEMLHLDSLNVSGDFQPTSVALTDDGSAYVTDNYNDVLYKFDYEGNRVLSLGITKPTGVDVDASGNVYVGSATHNRGFYTGEVKVYDSELNYLHSLGTGWGEFFYPFGVTVAGERVYVTDKQRHNVKVYDVNTGAYLFKVSQKGYSDGDLYYPNGIAVHPTTGNLYISDRAAYLYDGSYGPGASGHIFTGDGEFITRFGTFGFGGSTGELGTTAGIELDSANRVYITDVTVGNIQIFDDAGNSVCGYSMGELTMYPGGMRYGDDGRLFVATVNQVFIYGIDDYVKLAVSPSSLDFDAQQCGSTPAPQAITISNEGPGVLQWEISSDSSWISPSVSAGEINGVGSVNVSISVDPTGLGTGTHTGTLKVSSQGASANVSVNMTVGAPPELGVSPTSFSFEVKGSDVPAGEGMNVELTNDTGGSVTWEAAADSPWISVAPSSGPSNTLTVASVGISAAALEQMDSGEYTGTVTVSAACATGSPVDVSVSLNYIKGGTIKVSTNTEEATFIISGTVAGTLAASSAGTQVYTGSGMSYEVDAVPEGTYTISFGDIAGFKTPASYSLGVTNGAETAFVGDYIDLRESNNILATMGGGQWFVPQEVRIYDAAGTMGGSVEVVTATSKDSKDISTKDGMISGAGDIDGDGVDEIVVSYDKGVLAVFEANGTAVSGSSFRAFAADYESNVGVAVGDIDGDGVDEIVVGGGSKSGDLAAVRAFGYSGGAVYDTGVNFLAYDVENGVNVAVGDVDGDGASEIITAPGGSGKGTVEVRVWNVDTASGQGAWGVLDAGVIDAGESYGGADVAAGDLDADAVDEIIVSTTSKSSESTASVSAYSLAGAKVLDFTVSHEGSGLDIAAGDMDFDGMAEIVLGEGDDNKSSSVVRVFGPDGALKNEFKAFDDLDIYGVRVSLGQLVQ